MEYLHVIDEITGYTVRTDLSATIYSLIDPDPILIFARFLHDTRGYYSHCEITRKQTWRTAVRNQNRFTEGLRLFFEIFGNGRVPQDEPLSNWKPRERLSASGAFIEGVSVVAKTVGDFKHYHRTDLDSVAIDLYDLDGDYFLSFDLLRDYVERLYHKYDGNIEFAQYFAVSWRFVGKIILSQPTADRIDYTVVLEDFTTDARELSRDGGVYTYRVRIIRDRDQPVGCHVNVTDTLLRYLYSGVPTSSVPTLDVYTGTQNSTWVRDGRQTASGFDRRVRFSISNCAPGLFHTQSVAIRNGLGDVSRNFESLMESSALMPVVYDLLLTKPKGLLNAALTGSPSLERVREITRLICAGTLAYLFAVNPALKSLTDVIVTFLRGQKVAYAEAAQVLETLDVNSLPPKLLDMCQSAANSPIHRVRITFHTVIQLELSSEQSIELIAQLAAQGSKFGFAPEPVYAYNAVPFTFVVDWFIPVGALMKDIQSWITSLRLRASTVGHSVRIDIQCRSGGRFHVYLRSDATKTYFDPPMDSWLQAPGVFVPAAIPLVLLGIL